MQRTRKAEELRVVLNYALRDGVVNDFGRSEGTMTRPKYVLRDLIEIQLSNNASGFQHDMF